MKKLIFAVLLAILVLASGLVSASEIEPKLWEIRRGENLTKISGRYDLKVQDILDTNVGSKCIKTPDRILAGCKIAIPVERMPQVQVQNELNSRIFEEQKQKAETTQNLTRQNKQLSFALGVLVVILLGVFYFAVTTSSADKQQKLNEFSQKNLDLSKRLWEANDQRETLEKELKHVRIKLDIANQQLITKEGLEVEVKRLMDMLREQYNLVEERNRDLKNAEARISELEVFLEAEKASSQSAFSQDSEHTVSLKEKDVKFKVKVTFECQECDVKGIKPQNAKSHASQQHGDTTEHNFPD